MGADFSSACYGMALLPVSSVWDVFEFSGIAAGAGFDDSGRGDRIFDRDHLQEDFCLWQQGQLLKWGM